VRSTGCPLVVVASIMTTRSRSSNLDPFGLYDDARLYDALRRAWLVERVAAADASGQTSRFTLDSKVEEDGGNMCVLAASSLAADLPSELTHPRPSDT